MRINKALAPLATTLLVLGAASPSQCRIYPLYAAVDVAVIHVPVRPQRPYQDSTKDQKDSQTSGDLIVTDEKFTKDGVITYPDFKYLGMKVKAESGILNGVAYRIYYSGGAYFVGEKGGSLEGRPERVNWHVGCHKDDFSDVKSCVLSTRDIRIHLFADGGALINVGNGELYPGSDVAVRIDDDPAYIGGDEGRIPFNPSSRILERLKTAKRVRTRYVRCPSESASQDEWEPYGYNEALQFAKWSLSKIK